MPRVIDRAQLGEILEILNDFPDGATLQEVSLAQKKPMPLYTLQRRVAILVEEGSVKMVGKAKALKYFLNRNEIDEYAGISSENVQELYPIPLTANAKDIQRIINQPIQARSPVGYNMKFLDQYRPNVTRYLSDSICKQLLVLGKTDGNQPAGTYARQIYNRLLIDLSWNSSRLEGNTYSLLDTKRLLEFSEIAESKDLKEAKMIINHKEAIEFLVESASIIGINRHVILNLHAILSSDLLGELSACGRLRSTAVGIGQSVYQPLTVPQLIEEYFQQILDTAAAIHDPFEQAFFLMVHLPYLQPFEDVNKPVSRLAANIPLIKHNLCPLSFIDVPQDFYVNGLLGVYELNRIDLLRDVFIWAYKRSCQHYSIKRRELGDPDPFRMRYRVDIMNIVANIVRGCLDKKSAISSLKAFAENSVQKKDQNQFIEAVENELLSLHEGNIARHRLRPSEFQAWKNVWDDKSHSR